ncbi:uncharacterized protein isoform X2 [Rhodnius prolixus]
MEDKTQELCTEPLQPTVSVPATDTTNYLSGDSPEDDPMKVFHGKVKREANRVKRDTSSMVCTQKPEIVNACSSKCEDNEQSRISKEFMQKLHEEKHQRQCTFVELLRDCAQYSFGEKLAIFCDWIYANIDGRIALFGTSTVVPLCAWFTRVFWGALISQIIFVIFVWMFARFVFFPPTSPPLREAEKFDRQLYHQSQSHMDKMLKIKDKLELRSRISPSIKPTGEDSVGTRE